MAVKGSVDMNPIGDHLDGHSGVFQQCDHRARLARLQDETAIRDLHQTWLRRVNTGAQVEAASLCVDPRGGLHQAVSRVSADHAAAPDQISLAADGRSASGRYSCLVETETPRPAECTLAQMAHAQGEGMIRSAERRVLPARYVKAERGWVIETLRLEPV
jgi:hypothetical protein